MTKTTKFYFVNSKKEDDELGPENKEANTLMMALIALCDPFRHPKYQNDDEEDFSCTGVGRDTFGKYAYTDLVHKGIEYEIQLRDKSKLNRKRVELNKLSLTLLPTKNERRN